MVHAFEGCARFMLTVAWSTIEKYGAMLAPVTKKLRNHKNQRKFIIIG